MADLTIARLLCARLCHDLGGVTGALTGAMELLDSAGAEAAEVARESAQALQRRLLLWRALASGETVTRLGDVVALVDGQLAGGRATLDAAALPGEAELPEGTGPVLLAALLVAGEALPRGGTVRLLGGAEGMLAILPEGRNAAWPPALPAALSAAGHEASGPREILPVFLAIAAREAGLRLSLALGPGAGPPPLLIEPS